MTVRHLELRRHTDNDGDTLTAKGVADAEAIGRDGLHPPYAAFVSSGAARATRMLEILRRAAGQDDVAITVVPELRYSESVESQAALLGSALRRILDSLPDGGRALVVGHSPTTETAVLGLTGQSVPALSKGEGVLVAEDGATFRVQPLG
jgi:phosphohistidine phosphatase SixA